MIEPAMRCPFAEYRGALHTADPAPAAIAQRQCRFADGLRLKVGQADDSADEREQHQQLCVLEREISQHRRPSLLS